MLRYICIPAAIAAGIGGALLYDFQYYHLHGTLLLISGFFCGVLSMKRVENILKFFIKGEDE